MIDYLCPICHTPIYIAIPGDRATSIYHSGPHIVRCEQGHELKAMLLEPDPYPFNSIQKSENKND